jgi:cell division protein FtsI (penicillin-binding protein 3)/stage V sporulation protein D (sporulation-specific penicillin-binding protein)
MSQAFVCNKRAGLIQSLIALAFCVLLGRLFYLHIWNHQDLASQAESSRKMVKVMEARRGNIVDQRGNLLASTQMTIDLGLDPQSIRPVDRPKLPELARLLNKPLEEIERAFDTTTRLREDGTPYLVRWVSLYKGLDQGRAAEVKALGIKGVYGNHRYARTYPGGKLAAHVLGYVNKADVAANGVEQTFNYYLRGQDGWVESERDGRRREMAQYRDREVLPHDGLNLQLCLDQMIQHIVEREVDRLADEYDPESVSIIVSEPTTGALLALANYPSYDLNEYFNTSKYPVGNQRNRALTDSFEPGSTFKVVPIAAALNEGLVRRGQNFATNLTHMTYRGRKVGLPRDDHIKTDSLALNEVLIKSSNRASAQVGMLLGEQRLHDYAAAFGYGERTGCDLVGEGSGVLHPVRNWDGLTITRMPMGHAVSATPMQVHAAMSVMANRGILMEPMVARRIYDAAGETVVQFRPQAKRRVVSSETAELVAEMLADVVEVGTGRRTARLEAHTAAGKTGTTQKIENGRYSRTKQVTSFSGFLPAKNPQLVVTVVVDHPKVYKASGGKICGPAFKNIAQACISYLGIRPDRQASAPLALKPLSLDGPRRISN